MHSHPANHRSPVHYIPGSHPRKHTGSIIKAANLCIAINERRPKVRTGWDAAPHNIPVNGPAEWLQQASRRTAREDSDERHIVCGNLACERHFSKEGKTIGYP